MKILLTLLITAIFATSTYSQQVISKSEYDGNFKGSVSVTNDAFPFVFTVVTETFENGKLVSTETERATSRRRRTIDDDADQEWKDPERLFDNGRF